jgi:Flp pilus assembly protein TadG
MKLKFGVFSPMSRPGKPANSPGLFARLLRNEEGSILVYMTLVVPALIGVAGLAAEGASWLYKHRVVQSAADNAAFSAASAYAVSHSSDLTAQARAITANDYNLVHGVNGVTVNVNRPPSSACYSGTSHFTGANAIEVIVTQPQTPLLSKIWLSNTVNICGRAVAIVPSSGDCILALGTTGTVISATKNNLNIDLEDCSIFSNSSDANSIDISGNNDVVTADAIGTVGGISLHGNSKTTIFNPTTGDPPVSDPYASDAASWPRSGGTSQTNCAPRQGNTGGCSSATLLPGSYASGITFSNAFAAYTMSPGVYYVSGGDFTLSGNNTTVTGTGVTIVITDNHRINVTGNNSSLNLTAPTSGWSAGIAIWEPNSTGSNVIGANSFIANITGVVYTPNASVIYDGNTGNTPVCTQIVAKTFKFGGNSIKLTGACSSVPGMKVFGQIPALVE